MDPDLEQDYITIVATMREQIELLKAKVSHQQQGRTPAEEIQRKERKIKQLNSDIAAMSEEVRKLKETQRELMSELLIYAPDLLDVNPSGDFVQALEEIERLSSDLSLAKQEYADAQARQRSQNPSPVATRMNYITKKLAVLTTENEELTARVTAMEADRKAISELYTAFVEKLKGEERTKAKVRQLEQVATEKHWELQTLLEQQRTATLRTDNAAAARQLMEQLDQLREEKDQLEESVIQLQERARKKESAETQESSPVALKLKAEITQLELSLQAKRNMLKVKDQELQQYHTQVDALQSELQLVQTEKDLLQPQSAQPLRLADLAPSLPQSLNHTPKAGVSFGHFATESGKRQITAKPSPSKLNTSSYAHRTDSRVKNEHTRSAANSPYPVPNSNARSRARPYK